MDHIRAVETAQNRLFEAYGLDVESNVSELLDSQIRTHVSRIGRDSGDIPLVMIHGTGACGAMFAPLIAHFEERPVITFDRPGYGLSDPFEYHANTIRQTLVHVLADLLDTSDIERADIVGHSMGGHVALQFVREHPDRVRRLVILGAIPGYPRTSPPIPIRFVTARLIGPLLRRRLASGKAGVLEVAEIFEERETITDHPAIIDALAAQDADPKATAATFSEYRALTSLIGWRRSVHLDPHPFHEITIPTTLIVGQHDPLGSPDEMRSRIDGSSPVRLETVPTGHIPFLGQPERCAEIIRAA